VHFWTVQGHAKRLEEPRLLVAIISTFREPYHQVRSTWDSKFNGDVLQCASNPVYLFGLQKSNKVRCKAKVLTLWINLYQT
jgi:hypothetical protein